MENPDLTAERRRASFPLEAMVHLLDHDMSGGVSLREYFHFLMPQAPPAVVRDMVAFIESEKRRREALRKQQHAYVW